MAEVDQRGCPQRRRGDPGRGAVRDRSGQQPQRLAGQPGRPARGRRRQRKGRVGGHRDQQRRGPLPGRLRRRGRHLGLGRRGSRRAGGEQVPGRLHAVGQGGAQSPVQGAALSRCQHPRRQLGQVRRPRHDRVGLPLGQPGMQQPVDAGTEQARRRRPPQQPERGQRGPSRDRHPDQRAHARPDRSRRGRKVQPEPGDGTQPVGDRRRRAQRHDDRDGRRHRRQHRERVRIGVLHVLHQQRTLAEPNPYRLGRERDVVDRDRRPDRPGEREPGPVPQRRQRPGGEQRQPGRPHHRSLAAPARSGDHDQPRVGKGIPEHA